MKKTLWQEITDRWNACMPTFWKKIQRFWVAVTIVAAALVGAEELGMLVQLVPTMEKYVSKVSHYSLIIGLINSLMLRLTKDDQKTEKHRDAIDSNSVAGVQNPEA